MSVPDLKKVYPSGMKILLFIATFTVVGCLKFEKDKSVSSGMAETKETNPSYPVFLENSGPLNTLQYVKVSLVGNIFNFGNVNKIEISGSSGNNIFTLVDNQIKNGFSFNHLVDPDDDNIIVTISKKDGTMSSYEYGVSQEEINL